MVVDCRDGVVISTIPYVDFRGMATRAVSYFDVVYDLSAVQSKSPLEPKVRFLGTLELADISNNNSLPYTIYDSKWFQENAGINESLEVSAMERQKNASNACTSLAFKYQAPTNYG
ncbi:MAG: hypothetical protein C0404_09630, partial [Verrucomicrobia bacterium]|nr:hypothetical protein [Verrucomicrobiota bacterium]